MRIIFVTLFSFAFVSIGLFSGIMLTLIAILQKQWNKMVGIEYLVYFKGFLQVAKGNIIVSVLTFTSFLLPFGIAIFGTKFINVNSALLFASGLIFFAGCFLVTVFQNLPIYDEVVNWNEISEKENWVAIREKFFYLNIIRFFSSLISLLVLSMSLFI
ncbi:MAG: hypothetical protein JEZ00_10900 [Anaerolineaceae bacterium]|nr:hypothetical protein [Anaerolineaceae bacterium]